MGYIKSMYGTQSPDFIDGFLAAMDTYAVHKDGKRYIGSPEKELKSAMQEAVSELSDCPEDHEDEIDFYTN